MIFSVQGNNGSVRTQQYRAVFQSKKQYLYDMATVQVEIGSQSVQATITKAHNPDPIPSPDRVMRKEDFQHGQQVAHPTRLFM